MAGILPLLSSGRHARQRFAEVKYLSRRFIVADLRFIK